MLRAAVIVGVMALLAACSSLSFNTASKLRSLDYLNDDIASLVLAFDVPQTLEPMPEGSVLNFDVTTPASGERHVSAVLVRADASEVAGGLPALAAGRNYYLFGFSDADKQKLRDTQTWARALPAGDNQLAITLGPRFCRTTEIDPRQTRVSVLVALPGAGGLAPLVNAETLVNLLAAAGAGEIPACAGHSG